MNEIEKPKSIAASLQKRDEPSVVEMLNAMVQKGVTSENVLAMEQLVKLKERMDDREAERQFNAAFVALQAEMPKVQATREVHNSAEKGGGIRYLFAAFEDIMEQVAPLLQKHGFAVSFTNETAEGRMIKLCTLSHVGGHSRTNKFSVRIGKGPPGCSESQADGSAASYAKRFALCDILNITIRGMDDDARVEGTAISKEQSAGIQQRVEALLIQEKIDQNFIKKLLAFAGVEEYDEIPQTKWEGIDKALTARENKTVEEIQKMLKEKRA